LDASLAVDLLLEHFVSGLGVVNIVFHLLFSKISIDESDLSADLIFDHILILFFKLLLLKEHIADFFAEVEIKIAFHSSLRFVLN
jgi:hypothetical protein